MGRKIFAAVVAALFFYVASPLIFPVAMGAVLATLFIPWLEHLERRKAPLRLAASVLTLVIALFVILPSSVLISVGVKQAFEQIQAVRIQQGIHPAGALGSATGGWAGAFLSLPKVHAWLEHLTQIFPIRIGDVTQVAEELIRTAAGRLADLFGEFITHLPGAMVSMAVCVVSVYFFLMDGRKLVLFFRRNSMFSAHQTDQLIDALAGTCRSVILASVVSGAAQSVMELLVCLIAQIPNAALVGMLVFLASFIPVVGAVPITLGVAMQQFLADHEGRAFVLLGAALVVALVDGLIRPLFLRGTANLHPLVAFVAAFGGLQTLGISGVFLGPIIAAVFVVTARILFLEEDPIKSERPLL